MIKQNFFFLNRPMGTRKIPKSSTACILIVRCYELSRLIQSFALSAAICENKDYQTQVYRQDLRGPRIGQDVMLAVILGKRERILRRLEGTSTGLKSRDKAAMLHDKQYKFLVESAWKKKFSSQAREIHQLLSTNMAAVTSAINQQYGQKIIRFQTEMAWYLHVNKENDFVKTEGNNILVFK